MILAIHYSDGEIAWHGVYGPSRLVIGDNKKVVEIELMKGSIPKDDSPIVKKVMKGFDDSR